MNLPAPRVLVAPLDWGLGHATRCIPLIRLLQALGCEVVLAGDGRSLALLRHEFPLLPAEELPSYDIRYSQRRTQAWQMMRQIPAILAARQAEHEAVEEIVEEYAISHIISDNRYGVWHPDVPSVILTHQLAVLAPRPFTAFSHWLYRPHLRLLEPFERVWIPDVAGTPNLSGDLSHKYPAPEKVRFIGLLSRFTKDISVDNLRKNVDNMIAYPQVLDNQPDIVAVLSGPEPQRSILENQLVEQFAHSAAFKNRQLWIIQGKTEQRTYWRDNNIHYFSFMNTHELSVVYQRANVVISRGGYTSLMDFAALGLRNIILIPTPGQSEQEYLGAQMAQQGIAVVQQQHRFALASAIAETAHTQGFVHFPTPNTLQTELQHWLKLPTASPQLMKSW